jgi:hypothetical protein
MGKRNEFMPEELRGGYTVQTDDPRCRTYTNFFGALSSCRETTCLVWAGACYERIIDSPIAAPLRPAPQTSCTNSSTREKEGKEPRLSCWWSTEVAIPWVGRSPTGGNYVTL